MSVKIYNSDYNVLVIPTNIPNNIIGHNMSNFKKMNKTYSISTKIEILTRRYKNNFYVNKGQVYFYEKSAGCSR